MGFARFPFHSGKQPTFMKGELTFYIILFIFIILLPFICLLVEWLR